MPANCHPVSGAILSNVLSSDLRTKFSPGLIAQLTSSAFDLKDLNLSDVEIRLISNSYMDGIHGVFLSYFALTALHLSACLFIQDYGLGVSHANGEERTSENDNSDEAFHE